MGSLRRRDLLLGAAAALLGEGCEEAAASPAARRGIREAARGRFTAALPPFAPRRLREVRDRLAPLHARVGAPREGDWLADHPEPGQTFDAYLRSSPTAPTEDRRTLVVRPLGTPSPARQKIVELAGTYLGLHFGLPARVEAPASLGDPPIHAWRRHDGALQVRSRWILDRVLAPQLPADAAALLGFTEVDLWPGMGWNFVFGEASLERRVGVWSLARYGDPGASPEAFRTTLRRALKVAVHETGHMFSLPHCTAYRCVQAGINSLDEEDRAPLWLCPECLAKVSWVTSTDPRERLRATASFCQAHGLAEEAAFLRRSLATLG